MPKISLAFSSLFLFFPPLQMEIRWGRKRKETVLRYVLAAECLKLVLLLFLGLLLVVMFISLHLRPHIYIRLRSSLAVYMLENDRKSQGKWRRDYNQFSDYELCATSVDMIALNYNNSKCYCKYINSLIQQKHKN